jgi:hypothetical protein
MAGKTQEQKDAEAAAKAKEAEREAKAKAREEERARKAKEREEAKAAKAREQAEAKAAREREKIDAAIGDLPEDRQAALRKEHGDELTLKHVRDAVKAFRAEERANRPKKAPLTLSQRRAMLKLAEAGEDGIVPKTAFNALPLDHLVNVGLAETFETKREETYQETVEQTVDIPEAERKEGGPTTKTVKVKEDRTREVDATGYRLTEAGRERAGEVNPKWLTWKPEGASSDAA